MCIHKISIKPLIHLKKEGMLDKSQQFGIIQYICYLKKNEELICYLIEKRAFLSTDFDFCVVPKFALEWKVSEDQQKKHRGNRTMSTLKGSMSEYHSVTASNFDEYSAFVQDNINMQLATNAVNNLKGDVTKMLEKGQSTVSRNTLFKEIMKDYSAEIVLVCLKYKQYYGFEFSTFNQVMALYPISERYIFTIMGALCNNMGVMIRSNDISLKKETLRIFGNILGKNIYEMESKIHITCDSLNMFLSGTMMGGYWMMIKNFQD